MIGSYKMLSRPALTFLFILCLSNWVVSILTSEIDLLSENVSAHGNLNARTLPTICQSKDIRNSPAELMSLKGCRVIEGYLMITLIDHYNDTDYDNITFPELIEITDYLMLYRVQGLRSLAHLFPNLSVIRGNNLINNYALIIYEMLQLTEIGLKSLTNIVRGSVRIEKNPLLCFVDTINWTYIANGTQPEDHFFNSNKDNNECPVCETGRNIRSDIECAVSKEDPKKRYCWNRDFCQKICPDSCGTRSCDDKGNCCDEKCLGSCDATDSSNCTVCRKLSIGPLNNRTCVEECPAKLFMFEQRRCVTEIECWSIAKPFSTPGNAPKHPFIPFNGTCSWTCPKYYEADGLDGGRYCKSCNGECKKICHGSTIDSISGAQNYRGCTIIAGTLIIQIRQGGRNLIKELEQSLSDIEEIEGGLKIIRSYPLISLNFFKNLKVIRGINLQDNYALYVMGNQNLQSLFDKSILIERGKMSFHFNSKLCYATIEKMKNDVVELRGVEKLAIEDVGTNSNGDKVACNITRLTAKPSSILSIGAIIDVKAMRYDDTRVLLGYVLHFKPAPHANVSLFDSRDACGGDGWRVEETTNFDRRAPMVQIILTNLKPFTQYAYYVKTNTIASEPYGGQTDILYFRTLPGQPDIVQKLKVLQNGPSSLIVNWEPPKVANGKLSNYIVKASLIYDDPELLLQRNYCVEPISLAKVEHKPNLNTEPEECQCTDEDVDYSPSLTNEKSAVVEQIINFENEIQNIVYVKRTIVVTGEEPKDRRRRNMDEAGKYSNQSNSNPLDIDYNIFPTSQRTVEREKRRTNDFTGSKMVNDKYYEEFYDDTTKAAIHTFTLTKLRHFSRYSISVQACRNFDDPQFNVNTFCSNVVMTYERSEKIEDADDVEYLDYKKVVNSNNSLSMVNLHWPEPKDPNGLIVSYTITYKRVDLDNVKHTEQCISRHMHSNLSGEIPLLQLSNGNYSVTVRAISLAGDGKDTPPRFIEIDVSVEKLSPEEWNNITSLAFFKRYGFTKPAIRNFS